MVSDGAVAGRKVVGRVGTQAKKKAAKKSKRFTVVPILALSGEPVMCVLIVEGTERCTFIESGVDITKINDDLIAEGLDDVTLPTFESNYGPGKAFPGGPICSAHWINLAFTTPTAKKVSPRRSSSTDTKLGSTYPSSNT